MSSRGPLPDPNAVRRNAPRIPTTQLRASGPDREPPDVPETYGLMEAGRNFWDWAWRLPQACAWDDGSLYAVARRAQLEDDLAMLRGSDVWMIELEEFLDTAPEDLFKQIQSVFGALKRVAGGEVSLMKEIRELDNKLGLTPESMARLRWTIVADEHSQQTKAPAPASSRKEQRERLSVAS
jgi:hypothetical protein